MKKTLHTSKSGAKRYNKGKSPIHLVPPSAFTAMADVLNYGLEKYGRGNWQKGAEFSVPYSCAIRHLLAFWRGEDYDEESGELHLSHALTNVMMLLHYFETNPKLDDRDFKKRKKK